MKKYVVSACLVGENCKYDGGNNYNARVTKLIKEGFGTLVCPEEMGGLPTPRIPCEIIGDKVINKNGEDKTVEYRSGAEKTLKVCQDLGIKKAILKAKSPSCGKNKIYDGSFSSTLVKGNGVTAKLLMDNGIRVYSELDEPIYDAIVVAAGDSSRSLLPYNKVFHINKDGYVIEQALQHFVGDFMCHKVYVVVKEEEKGLFEAILNYSKVEYVIGGSTREESVYNALKLVTKKYVLIHDADRPLVSERLVDSVLDNIELGTVPYISESNKNDYSVNGMYLQTPQGYQTNLLKEVFEQEKDHLCEYRDESSMFSKYYEVKYIPGDYKNYKITYKEDVERFEKEGIEDENNY